MANVAHWIKHPDEREWDICSNCKTGVKRREYGWIKGDEWVNEESYQYCPWCGAKIVYEGKEEITCKDCKYYTVKGNKWGKCSKDYDIVSEIFWCYDAEEKE